MRHNYLSIALVFILTLLPIKTYSLVAGTVDNSMPKGDLPGWHQVFSDNFNRQNVPIGKFSDCDHNALTPEKAYCNGLPEPQKSRWWAYPYGWLDTAKQRKYPQGGIYNPEKTISIESLANGDGVMKI